MNMRNLENKNEKESCVKKLMKINLEKKQSQMKKNKYGEENE